MNAVTGRDIMTAMLELASDIGRWNKQNMSGCLINDRLQELGLTKHQMELMGFLYANEGLNTVSAISAELGISKGSLSLMLTKLKKAGYVEKEAAKEDDDGRKVYISLTEKGQEAVRYTMEALLSTGAVAFDEMDQKTRTLFYTKVKELKELFQMGGWKE
ncbi:MAG: MarR family transcriptional regulator [Anaerotignum sp.]|nr:MarR family transcriptional regulator [Anaerotignum sp.]MBR2851930.1 MarR family transcriptional regulator [Anaerotignum sp.]